MHKVLGSLNWKCNSLLISVAPFANQSRMICKYTGRISSFGNEVTMLDEGSNEQGNYRSRFGLLINSNNKQVKTD